MSQCEQTSGMSVLDHGRSVNNYYHDLKNHINKQSLLAYEWRLTDWISDPFLWSSLVDEQHINQYHLFHDCGKPFCLTIDEDGRRHFPEHAAISTQIWQSLDMPDIECDLIRHDMDLHIMKSEDLAVFCQLPYATTLLITAFCEIHSNASMFGGIDSTSFKIKWKKLNKLGSKIINIIKGEK